MFGAGSEPASVMEFGREPASNMFGASSEPASVMEFGFYLRLLTADCGAVQRSCRKRRRNARWSTTNWTPRSPNSPASRRIVVVDVSQSVMLCRAFSCHRPTATVSLQSGLLSLSLSPSLTSSLAQPKLPPYEQRLDSSVYIFYRKRVSTFYFTITTIYFVDAGKRMCRLSGCVEVALSRLR